MRSLIWWTTLFNLIWINLVHNAYLILFILIDSHISEMIFLYWLIFTYCLWTLYVWFLLSSESLDFFYEFWKTCFIFSFIKTDYWHLLLCVDKLIWNCVLILRSDNLIWISFFTFFRTHINFFVFCLFNFVKTVHK